MNYAIANVAAVPTSHYIPRKAHVRELECSHEHHILLQCSVAVYVCDRTVAFPLYYTHQQHSYLCRNVPTYTRKYALDERSCKLFQEQQQQQPYKATNQLLHNPQPPSHYKVKSIRGN